MYCNPLRWLWGIIPIAMLSWVAYQWELPRIEADLQHRAHEALAAADHGWASAQFSGRDAVLRGRAFQESAPRTALDVLRSVWGVRVARLETDLIRRVSDYGWSAAYSERRIELTGFVASEEARRAVIAAAEAEFPGARVIDRMELARGAPDQDLWLARITFALGQLGKLARGKVTLENTSIAISGEAKDPASLKALQRAFSQKLPAKLTDARNEVTPPLVALFSWSADYGEGKLALSGHVPSEAAQEDVFAHAKRAFPKTAIADHAEVAGGAPPEWARAVTLCLELLSRLRDGSVRLEGRVLRFSGLARDKATAESLRRALREGLPKPYVLTEDVRFLEAELPAARPFETSVDVDGSSVTLTGFAPSEAARMALIGAVRARLPDRKLTDRLRLATGAASAWQACLVAGLTGLARLGAGRVRLTDSRLEVSGEAANTSVARAAEAETRSPESAPCALVVRIAVKTPPPAAAPAAPETETGTIAPPESVQESEQEREEASRRAAAEDCARRLTETARSGVIHFDRASADIDSASTRTLDELVAIAKACPEARIEVAGHTDGEGEDDRNLRLSERRAGAVLTYLARKGVARERLTAVGYGAAHPVVPNDTPENRARNRRIEFSVAPN